MAKGGARPGAGRKKGSTTRPQLRDILTKEQIDALVAKGLEKAEAGDSLILKFLLEQVFGKAPQGIDLTSDNKPIAAIIGMRIIDDGKGDRVQE
jgi:hypothetical protein